VEFAAKLLEAGVVVTPGAGFGEHGEGYLRFALTIEEERIREALERIRSVI
jgi:LL-diaminopimelate aminotransferase